ncbi:MAG: Gmad2 immunoglobulin-like domain-containing protein [Actinomycetota bacterium]|nr:Gmad2 immunoglobulin-like domain-containing protein [Actinomycetota bacterium]
MFRLIRLAGLFAAAKWFAGQISPPRERIHIESPGELDLVTSPVQVSGTGHAAQHNALGVRIRDENGTEIGSGSVTVGGPLGQQGPFSGSVAYTLAGPAQRGRIEVLDTSPRDGQVTHLSSVEVTLS